MELDQALMCLHSLASGHSWESDKWRAESKSLLYDYFLLIQKENRSSFWVMYVTKFHCIYLLQHTVSLIHDFISPEMVAILQVLSCHWVWRQRKTGVRRGDTAMLTNQYPTFDQFFSSSAETESACNRYLNEINFHSALFWIQSAKSAIFLFHIGA